RSSRRRPTRTTRRGGERPGMTEWGELLEDARARSQRYLESLSDREAFPSAGRLERLSELDGPLPRRGVDPARVLELLDAVGSPATVASNGGRYFGYVIGGSLPAALAAHWLATA